MESTVDQSMLETGGSVLGATLQDAQKSNANAAICGKRKVDVLLIGVDVF